jgi:hypothetical protein
LVLEDLWLPTMDSTLFNEELWEPNGIVLSSSVGELNLLDYIKGGTAGDARERYAKKLKKN